MVKVGLRLVLGYKNIQVLICDVTQIRLYGKHTVSAAKYKRPSQQSSYTGLASLPYDFSE